MWDVNQDLSRYRGGRDRMIKLYNRKSNSNRDTERCINRVRDIEWCSGRVRYSDRQIQRGEETERDSKGEIYRGVETEELLGEDSYASVAAKFI